MHPRSVATPAHLHRRPNRLLIPGRLLIPAAAALALMASAGAARGDRLSATLGQPLREVAHDVQVTVKDGVARYVVRRSFANAGKRHEEASLRIVLPYGAAATGLRIRSAKRWYKGELMRVERARKLYKELTGMGPHTPRDPALLQWVWANELHLQVFPVPPGGTSTVEYTLTVPTSYTNGRYALYYPEAGSAANLAPVVLRVFPPRKVGARLRLGKRPIPPRQPVVLRRPPTKPQKRVAGRVLSDNASHAVSQLDVRRPGAISKATLKLDLRHTYRGDLIVHLVTPRGRWLALHNRKGGSKNDIRKTFELPALAGTQARGRWRLVVSDHAPRDVGSINAWSLRLERKSRRRPVVARALDVPLAVRDAPSSSGGREDHTRISMAPARINIVAARLGRVVASKNKSFLRLELDAAPQLMPKPKHLQVVFVVDASYSVERDGLRGQLAVARAFLSHVPDARYNVVLYRRRAHAMLPAFSAAPRFARDVALARAHAALDLGNGSALDAGVTLAARLLRQRRGAKMIVMLGDAMLRPSFTNAPTLRVLRRTARGLTAHFARVNASGYPSERRDDKHPLAALAKARGGVLLHLDGTLSKQRAQLRHVVLGLVRPVRIDHLRVVGLPAKGKRFSAPKTFYEGAGLRQTLKLASAPRRLTLVGQLWSRPFRRVVRVQRAFSRTSAAWVFSHDLHRGHLSRAEMLRVARFGRAVSPVTAYLAIEPGVRPSVAGIDRRLVGMGAGAGGYGRGGFGLSGRGYVRLDLAALLGPYLAKCRKRYPRPQTPGELRVDTTYREIVDVALVGAKTTPFSRCAVEQTWRARLSTAYTRARQRFTVAL